MKRRRSEVITLNDQQSTFSHLNHSVALSNAQDIETILESGRVLRSAASSAIICNVPTKHSTTHSKQLITTPCSSSSSSTWFCSCLTNQLPDETEVDTFMSPRSMPREILLQRSLSVGMRNLGDESWLSSSLIDLVISRFASIYKQIHFMSIDFAVLSLSSADRNELEQLRDIQGRVVDYQNPKAPIVFFCNANGVHWNLIRVLRHPTPQLQVFEPMGKPVSRHGGLNLRCIPLVVVKWLNICCPLSSGSCWLTVGKSAITSQQQNNGVDCGVACLLYAEKCGQGHTAEQINSSTTQADLSEYRAVIKKFVHQVTSPRYFDLTLT